MKSPCPRRVAASRNRSSGRAKHRGEPQADEDRDGDRGRGEQRDVEALPPNLVVGDVDRLGRRGSRRSTRSPCTTGTPTTNADAGYGVARVARERALGSRRRRGPDLRRRAGRRVRVVDGEVAVGREVGQPQRACPGWIRSGIRAASPRPRRARAARPIGRGRRSPSRTARGMASVATARSATPTIAARIRGLTAFESIPDAAQRRDRDRVRLRLVELAAQARHGHVERLGRAEPVLVPDVAS